MLSPSKVTQVLFLSDTFRRFVCCDMEPIICWWFYEAHWLVLFCLILCTSNWLCMPCEGAFLSIWPYISTKGWIPRETKAACEQLCWHYGLFDWPFEEGVTLSSDTGGYRHRCCGWSMSTLQHPCVPLRNLPHQFPRRAHVQTAQNDDCPPHCALYHIRLVLLVALSFESLHCLSWSLSE